MFDFDPTPTDHRDATINRLGAQIAETASQPESPARDDALLVLAQEMLETVRA